MFGSQFLHSARRRMNPQQQVIERRSPADRNQDFAIEHKHAWRKFAKLLGLAPDEVSLDHVGLNHLTWERAVRLGGPGGEDVLPKLLAAPLSRLEPYGMVILIGILIVLPLAGSQFGLNLDVISAILRTSTGYVIRLLLLVTGNA